MNPALAITITLLVFAGIDIIFAKWESRKIEVKRLWIKHGVNGAIFLAECIIPYILFKNYFLIAALLMERLILYSVALNIFRRKYIPQLKWYYSPKDPAAITDKINNFIWGYKNMDLGYVVYTVVLAALIAGAYLVS